MHDAPALFAALCALLRPHAAQLVLTVDSADELSLHTHHRMANGQPLWFGGVHINKRYVSYHLMPVYIEPTLLSAISPQLKQRMQGKSCFNFTKPDPARFAELAALTTAGMDCYRERGYVA